MSGYQGARAKRLLPPGKFVVGKRLKKLGAEDKFALPGAGLALPFNRADGDEPGYRLRASGDNDFFSL
jgi:hypothetical protein